ncbi:MAG: hypothetical protein ACKVE4_01545 [Dissulfuribacterales bacterium]
MKALPFIRDFSEMGAPYVRCIAVGSKNFIYNVKFMMGVMARGRTRIEAGESFQLQEAQIPDIDHFGGKKSEIGAENAYVWD